MLAEKLSSLELLDLANNNNNSNIRCKGENESDESDGNDESDENESASFLKFLSDTDSFLESSISCYDIILRMMETTKTRDLEYTSLVISKLQIARAEQKK